MKKGIIVLLITVLAAGMAFAGLTGSAAINLGYDLDTKDYGFANDAKATYKFTFEFDTASAEVADHQTNVWAEIAAEASAYINYSKKDAANGYKGELVSLEDGSTINVVRNPTTNEIIDVVLVNGSSKFGTVKIAIKKANIHVNDFTFGILNAGGAYNYAADYHLDDDGDPILDKVKSEGKKAPGFTVSYNGYSAGFGFKGNSEAKTYNVLAHAQTKSFDLAEGLSAQAAAYAFVSDAAKNFYGAAKAAYAADKLSADAAAEIAINDSKVNVEAAANASYDFVYANVYFYTLALDREANVKPYLDAKVGAGYTFAGDVEVKVNGFVDAENVLADAREITVGADATATVAPVSVLGKVSYGIYGKQLALEGKVTYNHEVFTAYAQLKSALTIGADPALTSLKPELSVSTDKIVENAGLALTWKGADFAKGIEKKGAITASATIKF